MCLSFVWRRDSVFIGMNFDYRQPYKLATKDPSKFIVLAQGKPSFGVNSDGAFINHLMVEPAKTGEYKRGKNVVHTMKLIQDVLNGSIAQADIGDYLDAKEIVNVPDSSCHCMIADKKGNVWIVEPGRGTIFSPATESPFYLMSNFSLCDCAENCILAGDGVDRYTTALELLRTTKQMDVTMAFEVLAATKQNGGDYPTVFSFVYSRAENAVFYAVDGDFTDLQKFTLTD